MKIAIVGAAYTGLAACRYLKQLGHHITVTTTKESRKGELEAVSDKVIVMYGSDEAKMKELLGDILEKSFDKNILTKGAHDYFSLDKGIQSYYKIYEKIC